MVREGGRSSNPQPIGYEQEPLSPGDTGIKIVPIGIELLNQSYFPVSIPFLQALLPSDRALGIIELLKIDQSVDFILLRKAIHEF
jgi:hypothetical protein